jgi:ribosomal protein S18 acetylase RimI-like enzyme
MNPSVEIRDARADEFQAIGQLLISVYAKLEGFPSEIEQPDYYRMLLNVGELLQKPETALIVAVDSKEQLQGAVVYFGDMQYYGSGGTATLEKNAAGFRLLAVEPAARGKGIGQALTQECIRRAREKKKDQLILHTTRAMQVAWKMYEWIGFKRSEELDFLQGELPVFGFRLMLK